MFVTHISYVEEAIVTIDLFQCRPVHKYTFKTFNTVCKVNIDILRIISHLFCFTFVPALKRTIIVLRGDIDGKLPIYQY